MNCGSFFLREISANDVFVQARRHRVGFDVGDEPVPVLLSDEGFEGSLSCGIAGLKTHAVLVVRGARQSRRGTVVELPRSLPASCASEMSVSARRMAH